MISLESISPRALRRRERRHDEAAKTEAADREYALRFAVATQPGGAVAIRYFRNPQDAEGVDLKLTPLEAAALSAALIGPGTHFIQRDDREEVSA
jgi:hypothetical protein